MSEDLAPALRVLTAIPSHAYLVRFTGGLMTTAKSERGTSLDVLDTLCHAGAIVRLATRGGDGDGSGGELIATCVAVSSTALILDRWDAEIGMSRGDPIVVALDDIERITIS